MNRYLDFDEYIRQGEPQQRERAEAWRVAVDGLKTSEYLPPNLARPEQVPHKYPTSTPQVRNNILTDNFNITKLLCVIGKQELSVKEIMTSIGLKDRKNLITLYLNPAISEGFVCMLYPDKPRHPRQQYLLTVKGIALFNELTKEQ